MKSMCSHIYVYLLPEEVVLLQVHELRVGCVKFSHFKLEYYGDLHNGVTVNVGRGVEGCGQSRVLAVTVLTRLTVGHVRWRINLDLV